MSLTIKLKVRRIGGNLAEPVCGRQASGSCDQDMISDTDDIYA
jgi:hypothetical protein